MALLAALAGGLEDGIGVSANTVTYIAGKNLGRQLACQAEHTDDIQEALVRLGRFCASTTASGSTRPSVPSPGPS